MTEFVLGTAQLGMPYGIAGPEGGVQPDEARAILEYAWNEGVRYYDTAAGYGHSEQILGKILGNRRDIKIITKLRALLSDSPSSCTEQVQNSVISSLKFLQTGSCEGILVHRVTDLIGPKGDEVWSALEKERALGHTQKIGVSVYETTEIDTILERYPIDLIQLPLNILDQRILKSGHLDLLRQNNIEIHARSVFMQGLLLFRDSGLPDYFSSLKPLFGNLRRDAENFGLDMVQVALSFVQMLPQVNAIVTGVDNVEQLEQIINQWRYEECLEFDYSNYAVEDAELLNPSRWPKMRSLHNNKVT